MTRKKEWVLSASRYKLDFVKKIDHNGYLDKTKSMKSAMKFSSKMEAAFMIDDVNQYYRDSVKPMKAELYTAILRMETYDAEILYTWVGWNIKRIPNVGSGDMHTNIHNANHVFNELVESNNIRRCISRYKTVTALLYEIKPYTKKVLHSKVFEATEETDV